MISLYRNKSSLLTCFDFTLLLQKIVEKSSKEKIKVMKIRKASENNHST